MKTFVKPTLFFAEAGKAQLFCHIVFCAYNEIKWHSRNREYKLNISVRSKQTSRICKLSSTDWPQNSMNSTCDAHSSSTQKVAGIKITACKELRVWLPIICYELMFKNHITSTVFDKPAILNLEYHTSIILISEQCLKLFLPCLPRGWLKLRRTARNLELVKINRWKEFVIHVWSIWLNM